MDHVRRELIDKCYAAVLPGIAVGPHDNFFEIGGDSVQLIRLVATAQDVFDIEIDAMNFFVEPTLDCLAATVLRQLAEPSVWS